MDGLTRISQKPEKPSRLQLAILEWQRQLVLKRASRVADETQPATACSEGAPASLGGDDRYWGLPSGEF